jgi:hypothetical protein
MHDWLKCIHHRTERDGARRHHFNRVAVHPVFGQLETLTLITFASTSGAGDHHQGIWSAVRAQTAHAGITDVLEESIRGQKVIKAAW